MVAHHPLDLPCGPKRTSFAEANLTQLGSTDSVRGWEVDHPKAANTRKGNWLHTARLLVVSGHCQHKTMSGSLGGHQKGALGDRSSLNCRCDGHEAGSGHVPVAGS